MWHILRRIIPNTGLRGDPRLGLIPLCNVSTRIFVRSHCATGGEGWGIPGPDHLHSFLVFDIVVHIQKEIHAPMKSDVEGAIVAVFLRLYVAALGCATLRRLLPNFSTAREEPEITMAQNQRVLLFF